MKLLLRRSQRTTGMLGNKIVFLLSVRAELSPEERTDITKYKLGNELLYTSKTLDNVSEGWKGVGQMVLHGLTTLSITVGDLERGKEIECKDIVEMLAAEEQVKQSATVFKRLLHAASTFGGEEVLELA